MKPNSKISLHHGHAIRAFPLRDGYLLPPTLKPLMEAYATGLRMMDEAVAKAEAIRADRNLSPLGQREGLKAWARENGAPALRQLVGALQAAERAREDLCRQMTDTSIDKTDVGGALLRGEIRTWLRGLEPSKRSAMLMAGEPDPVIALAVTEAPPELSGVTPRLHQSLSAAALKALHPEKAAELAEIDAAVEVLGDVYRAMTKTVQEVSGMSRIAIEEVAGAPTLSERLRARLRTEGDSADLRTTEEAEWPQAEVGVIGNPRALDGPTCQAKGTVRQN